MENNLSPEIRWRGSRYVLESVDGETINWYNPVSRHRESCTVENWKREIPYDRELGCGNCY